MSTRGSLPYSQHPVTEPYPEPPKSNRLLHNLLPSHHSKYFPPIYAKVSQVVCTHQAGTLARSWYEFVTCLMRATFPPDQSTVHSCLVSDTFNLRYNFSLKDH